jgi:hypothetical protein
LWQVRFEDDGNRMVCYAQEYREDPYLESDRKRLTTALWSSRLIARPETQMTGLSWLYGGYANMWGVTPQGAGGYVIYRPEHWVFEGCGVAYGDVFGRAGAIMRYEVDGCPIRMENGLPYPARDYEGPETLEILGMIPAGLYPPAIFTGGPAEERSQLSQLAEEVFGDARPHTVARISHNHAVMSLYTRNGTVFCAGTADWTYGLTGQDPAVEQVTRNLLDRLSL